MANLTPHCRATSKMFSTPSNRIIADKLPSEKTSILPEQQQGYHTTLPCLELILKQQLNILLEINHLRHLNLNPTETTIALDKLDIERQSFLQDYKEFDALFDRPLSFTHRLRDQALGFVSFLFVIVAFGWPSAFILMVVLQLWNAYAPNVPWEYEGRELSPFMAESCERGRKMERKNAVWSAAFSMGYLRLSGWVKC